MSEPDVRVLSVSKYVSGTEIKQSKITPQPIGLEVHTISKALQAILETSPEADHFIVDVHRDWFGTTVTAKTELPE